MTLEEAKKICDIYRHCVEANDEGAWRALWHDDKPQLVVAYGRGDWPPPIGAERYIGKDAIATLIFGAKNKLQSVRITDEKISVISNEPAAFFWRFHLEFTANDGWSVDNDLLIKITLVEGKIKEFLEFGDPRKRGALFRYLRQVNETNTRSENCQPPSRG